MELVAQTYKGEKTMGNAAKVVRDFPVPETTSIQIDDELGEQEKLRHLNWLGRRWYELGFTNMATSQKPPGFYWNWSVMTAVLTLILFLSAVFAAIAGGAYYFGLKEAEIQQIRKEAQDAKKAAEQAEKLQTYNAGVTDSHKETEKEQPTPKKKEKKR